MGQVQAGCATYRTVDVHDGCTGPTHHGVVVAEPRLVARNGTGRLNPSHQSPSSQDMQYSVHHLLEDPEALRSQEIPSTSASASTASSTTTCGRASRSQSV